MDISRRHLLASSALAGATVLSAADRRPLLYIGAYTSDKNKGITVCRLDPATGAITDMTLAAETPNPTFLELHPSGRFLYAVNEIGNYDGAKAGSVVAYSIDRPSGKLTQLNRVSTKGPGPCHVTIDKSGRMAMIANYGGGSIASYRILEDGKLSEPVSFFQHEGSAPAAKGRQQGPHAHSVNTTPDNKYAVVCDLGLDQVLIYSVNPAKGSMEKHKSVNLAPGAGPRHFAWHPSARYGYSVNELNSTVTAFLYDREAGTLDEIQSLSTLADDFKGNNSTAEIRVHPSGKFLYASNRGDDSIAVFTIDRNTGKLQRIDRTSTQGVMPRNFFVEPAGRWLMAANQKTDNVIVFEIDTKTGKLGTTGKGITVGAPVCLRTLA
jgi:6-phosphogluconolactonase